MENPREFLGYTAGYNHTLFAQRVHDILSALAFVRHHDHSPARVDVVALGGAGRWAASACAAARGAVDALAVDTGGFRFGEITELRDPDLWPGAVKYGDLPALLALCAPTPLWLAGEAGETPGLVRDAYNTAGTSVVADRGPAAETADSAVTWLLGGA